MGFAQTLHLIVLSAAITGYPIDPQYQHFTIPLCPLNSIPRIPFHKSSI
jgi:hypothetical protein